MPDPTKGVTPRQKAIIDARIAGKSMPQIGKEHGISAQRVCTILKQVQPQLQKALQRHGYGVDESLKNLIEMTTRTETKFFAHKGVVLEEREVNDNATQLHARVIMANINGLPTGAYRDELRPDAGASSGFAVKVAFDVRVLQELRDAGIPVEVSYDAGPVGQPVLDEALHQDQGQPGPGQSVQALPEKQGLSPAPASPVRKRARIVRRKKPHDDDKLVGRS